MRTLQILSLVTLVFLLMAFKKNIDANVQSLSPVPEIKIADAKIVEGNQGQRKVQVMITISGDRTGPVTLDYSTKDGGASDLSDYTAAKGSLSFAPEEILKRITIFINGDVAIEPDETFEIVLSNLTGATSSRESGKVVIVNDDFRSGASVPISLFGYNTQMAGTTVADLSVYEVRLSFTGYTSLTSDNTGCGARSKGEVVLTGLVAGPQKVGPDDDITYIGILQLDMDIDMCSVTRLPNGEDKLCAITAIGSGPVNVELKIQYDQRGGYIKMEHTSGLFLKNAFGSCDHAQITEEEEMIPNRTITSYFNGMELPMLTNIPLRVGRYVSTADNGETVVEVLRKIR